MSLYEILFTKFDYYAKPEGHAPLEKVLGCAKYGVAVGVGIGMHDVIAVSQTKTMLDTLRCFGYWIVPLTGMAATFASTTYIATNLRGKDDPLNYVLGAVASGGILHAWQKSGLTTLYGTMLLSIFAAVKKDSKQSGWTFAGDRPDCEFHYPLFSTSRATEKKYERGWTKE